MQFFQVSFEVACSFVSEAPNRMRRGGQYSARSTTSKGVQCNSVSRSPGALSKRQSWGSMYRMIFLYLGAYT